MCAVEVASQWRATRVAHCARRDVPSGRAHHSHRVRRCAASAVEATVSSHAAARPHDAYTTLTRRSSAGRGASEWGTVLRRCRPSRDSCDHSRLRYPLIMNSTVPRCTQQARTNHAARATLQARKSPSSYAIQIAVHGGYSITTSGQLKIINGEHSTYSSCST